MVPLAVVVRANRIADQRLRSAYAIRHAIAVMRCGGRTTTSTLKTTITRADPTRDQKTPRGVLSIRDHRIKAACLAPGAIAIEVAQSADGAATPVPEAAFRDTPSRSPLDPLKASATGCTTPPAAGPAGTGDAQDHEASHLLHRRLHIPS